jgi:hypothetical protein
LQRSVTARAVRVGTPGISGIAFQARDRAQILVDRPHVIVRIILQKRPRHKLKQFAVKIIVWRWKRGMPVIEVDAGFQGEKEIR